MPFEWHTKKADSNFEKHGVSFEEAVTAFDDPNSFHRQDRAHSIGEQRYICVGFSIQGRLLTVAYTERTGDITRIISAREADAGEQRVYERQDYDS
ncbi:MAG: BrnT family toxin [Acidobacteriota bacterium]|nr:BrnT family toxin [Acidobacteriota bacterium]